MTTILTDAQLKTQIAKCEYCEEKPCKNACPANCSPADFIMAAKMGDDFDYKRAAAMILSKNPMGGVCGAVCPDSHCMSACVHNEFDCAVNIPAIQATIIDKAHKSNLLPEFNKAPSNGKKIAVVGAGPAGISAAALLTQKGYAVTVIEKSDKAGGRCNYIPDARLNKTVLQNDLKFVHTLGDIAFKPNTNIANPADLLKEFDGVIVATGLDTAIGLNVPGAEFGMSWDYYLQNSKNLDVTNKQVAVIGGGAVAADCAVTAKSCGAARVDMICLESNTDMPLTTHEKEDIFAHDINIFPKTTVTEITQATKLNLATMQINFPKGGRFDPNQIIAGTSSSLNGYDFLIFAIGSRSSLAKAENDKVIYAGDLINGPTTVVEAAASGKNAAMVIDAQLNSLQKPTIENQAKSDFELPGLIKKPVDLTTDFFGTPMISPFILSAAPPSDGYEQVKKAYDAGWAGVVMKTAFNDVDIHIPGEYMFLYNDDTYANCDNVSGHPLSRVCAEIKQLVKEYPDRITMASTGGPVTGDDNHDKAGWQSNTRLIEQSGAMGIEYSLSCPQGGDGTEGDIVSQNAALTAKIIDWVMEISDPNIPKLFKLTGAVTSMIPIINAIKEVFDKYPNKKAGVTLANTFPTLTFRPGTKESWDEGIIAGMSGDAVKYISYLTLANVSHSNVAISGNGGPMDYKAAANFLALGAKNVQFCTIAMKYGVDIINELESGLSHLMAARGIESIEKLIGCALPDAVTGFMDLTPVKKISCVDKDLCQHCGNCARCSYFGISLDENKIPQIDPVKCIGCSICTQKCFAGALSMRDRTADELKVLKED